MTTCNHNHRNRHAIVAVKRLGQSKLELNTQELSKQEQAPELNTQELSKQEQVPELNNRSSLEQHLHSSLMSVPGYKTTELEPKNKLGSNRLVLN